MTKPRPQVYTHTGPDLPEPHEHAAMHREMVAPMAKPPRHDGEAYHGQHPPGPPARSAGLGGGMGGSGGSVAHFGD